MERPMSGWDFEVDAWSRFWRWNMTRVCVWTCDMNSTLGSVVPSAMFMDDSLNGHCIFFLRSLPFSSSDRYLFCGRFKNEIPALLPNRLGWVDVHLRSSPVGRYIPGWRDVWVDKGLLPNPVSSTNIQTSFLGHPTPGDELRLKRSLLISIESFNHCCPVSLFDCQSLSIMPLKISNLSAGVSRAKRSLLTKSQALPLPLSLQGH